MLKFTHKCQGRISAFTGGCWRGSRAAAQHRYGRGDSRVGLHRRRWEPRHCRPDAGRTTMEPGGADLVPPSARASSGAVCAPACVRRFWPGSGHHSGSDPRAPDVATPRPAELSGHADAAFQTPVLDITAAWCEAVIRPAGVVDAVQGAPVVGSCAAPHRRVTRPRGRITAPPGRRSVTGRGHRLRADQGRSGA